MEPVKIIFGLGNPGVKYKNNRHNIGYRVIDALAKENNASFRRKLTVCGFLARVRVEGETVLIVKPSAFMNNSGTAVKKTLSAYGVSGSKFLVVCDDIDLPLGMIRFRSSGSSGGHRGLESVINCLGEDKVNRLRVGIGTSNPREDLADYVLSDFVKDEIETLNMAVETAAKACIDWAKFNNNFVMQKYNRKQRRNSCGEKL